MSIIGVAFIALVVVLLLVGGIVIGWTIGTNDRQIDMLARRLSAGAAISRATRETLHAMRDAVRRSSK